MRNQSTNCDAPKAKKHGALNITLRIISYAGVTALAALITCMALVAPVSAQITESEFQERLKNVSDWDELCEITDCDQFPLGHATYVFGSTVYYFPQATRLAAVSEVLGRGTVRPAQFVDLDEKGKLLRSFGSQVQLSISDCCGLLLFYYGFEDSFPPKRDRDSRVLLPLGQLTLSPHDDPSNNNRVSIKFIGDVDEFSPVEEIITPDTPSYNDDFGLFASKAWTRAGVALSAFCRKDRS